MLIPIHDSISPENSFFIENLQNAKKQIEQANLIIAIGYNFGDEAFVKMMGEIDFTKKDIILVCKKSIGEDLQKNSGYQRVKKSWKNANLKIFDGDGFSEFMEAVQ